MGRHRFYYKSRYPSYQVRSSNSIILRNPCLVFIISFIAIGSIRFRERHNRLRQHDPSLSSLTTTTPKSLRYLASTSRSLESSSGDSTANRSSSNDKKHESNKDDESVSFFIKYKVVDQWSGRQISVQEWAEHLLTDETEDDNDKSPLVLQEHDAPVTKGSFSSLRRRFTKQRRTSHHHHPALKLCQELARVPYPSFNWELPGVRPHQAPVQPMEFVVVKTTEKATARGGDRKANDAFGFPASRLPEQSKVMINDAQLIVPNKLEGGNIKPLKRLFGARNTPANTYRDLGSFCSKASPEQIITLWQTVANQYLDQLATAQMQYAQQAEEQHSTKKRKPPQPPPPPAVWLYTTLDDDISMLHFRLETGLQEPKHYHYSPFVTAKTAATTNAAASVKQRLVVATPRRP